LATIQDAGSLIANLLIMSLHNPSNQSGNSTKEKEGFSVFASGFMPMEDLQTLSLCPSLRRSPLVRQPRCSILCLVVLAVDSHLEACCAVRVVVAGFLIVCHVVHVFPFEVVVEVPAVVRNSAFYSSFGIGCRTVHGSVKEVASNTDFHVQVRPIAESKALAHTRKRLCENSAEFQKIVGFMCKRRASRTGLYT